MGQEECQYQFRNNRWNCTTSSPSVDLEDIYGEVVEISKLHIRCKSVANRPSPHRYQQFMFLFCVLLVRK